MKASLLTAATSLAGQSVKTVHTPLNLPYGANRKISTNITIPATNATIEVVYDSGSENFFLFGPGAIDNWGSSAIGTQGPCNASVPADRYFDYPKSTTATAPVDHPVSYVYGGADKIYLGSATVNDTFELTNIAGQSETVTDVRVQLVDLLTQRINDPQCTIDSMLYDSGIMGISPYYNNASTRVTAGPSIRQDLLERGVIDAPVQCMWFDEAPEDVYGTYTGGGLFGGIDTSKYSGDLVKVATNPPSGYVGYFTGVPTVSVGNTTFTKSSDTYCQLDSGTHDDSIPVTYEEDEEFYNATGLVISPVGYVSWPGKCEDIPADKTVDLTFPGATDGESVTIKVPLRAYVRVKYGTEEDYCSLSLSTNGCFLGSPFASASFFAADDENEEIALAQGGVSTSGAAVDESAVVARIP